MSTEFKSEWARLEIESVEKKDHACFQRTHDMRWLDSHTEDGGMLRCLSNIREEAALEKEFQERTDHAALVNERARKESALCSEINKIREEKLAEEYRRQQLRDNDPELRDLVRRLRSAYVGRDQRQQILHHEYKRLQERHEELQANERLQEALYSEKEDRETEANLQSQRQSQYCAALQRQIVNTHRRRQCLYEDTLIEKKMLDDVIKKVYEEDMRELQLKKEKVRRNRREQKLHQEAQMAWRDQHKRRVYEEEKRLQLQATEIVDRDAAVAAERKRRLEMKEAINKRVGAVLLEQEANREERNNIIMSLQHHEYIEKSLNDSRAEKEKLARSKRENEISLKAQMGMRKEQAARQRELDRTYREDIEKQIRKETEKEQQKELQKRQRQQQYTMELHMQMRHNEARRQRERSGGSERDHCVHDYNADRQCRIAAEREKLIEEHVPHLLGYLPPGTLDKSDLSAVRRGADKCPELAALDLEVMGQTRAPLRFAKCNEQCKVLRQY